MVDVSTFVLLNVADTCSLWNVLASRLLFATAHQSGVRLCATDFVLYECLYKPGKFHAGREELKQRLRRQLGERLITAYSIDIEDLQEVEALRSRKRLSVGELSAMVFARKTQQAVMTDDLKAQKLAHQTLGLTRVQSTPHLFAWLYFHWRLNDSDKQQVLEELAELGQNIQPHLDDYHAEAQRCRSLSRPIQGADEMPPVH